MKELGKIMRDRKLDCFKGILTIQMILAHCLQFYSDLNANKAWWFITEYINLTTFSGFVFAYGYVSHKAYFQGEFSNALKRISRNIIKLMVAFYISSFAFVIFIEAMPLRMDRIKEIIYLKRLAGWSEFLVAFAGIMLLTIVLWKLFKSQKTYWLILISLASTVVCLLPHREVMPIVGIFIGGHGGTYFPVIPFYLYFIIGVYFAKMEVEFNWQVLLLASLALAYTLYDALVKSKGFPSRFPLSLGWLLGGMIFLYGYYLLSDFIGKKKYFAWLSHIGRYSLYYLLISNIIIFAVKQSRFFVINKQYALGIFLVIMFTINYLIGLVKSRAKN